MIIFQKMNVVAKLAHNCLMTLDVEVPVARVELEWEKIVNELQKAVFISGYRKGSAPIELVESKFSGEIRKKLQEHLLHSALCEAMNNRGLQMLSLLQVRDVDLRKKHPFRFSAQVVVAPTFELPVYKGITLEILEPSVSERDVTAELSRLQQVYASYEPIEGRGLRMGDFAVLSYETQCDGKLVKESLLGGIPQPLLSRKYSWFQLDVHTMLPGFSEALLGAEPGERRRFVIKVQEEFPYRTWQGKKILFDVVIEAVQQAILPAWSDQLASLVYPGKTLQELKSLLLDELKDKAKQDFALRKRQALINFFLSYIEKIQPDLPKHLVESETQFILQGMRQDLANRAKDEDDACLSQEEALVGWAKKDAENRLSITFLLLRIAAKENIQVSEEEVVMQVLEISRRYHFPPPKIFRELRRKDTLNALKERILVRKTLDFLVANASLRQPDTIAATV